MNPLELVWTVSSISFLIMAPVIMYLLGGMKVHLREHDNSINDLSLTTKSNDDFACNYFQKATNCFHHIDEYLDTLKRREDIMSSRIDIIAKAVGLIDENEDSEESVSDKSRTDETTANLNMDDPDRIEFDKTDMMEIRNPDRGFFGYMFRCKSSKEESMDGNYAFVENGNFCLKKIPESFTKRMKMRGEWANIIRSGKYPITFLGQILYSTEETTTNFYQTLVGGEESKSEQMLKSIYENLLIEGSREGRRPMYAVTHMKQIKEEGKINWPHIHVLWS